MFLLQENSMGSMVPDHLSSHLMMPRYDCDKDYINDDDDGDDFEIEMYIQFIGRR